VILRYSWCFILVTSFLFTSCATKRQVHHVSSCEELQRTIKKNWKINKKPEAYVKYTCKNDLLQTLDFILETDMACIDMIDTTFVKNNLGIPDEEGIKDIKNAIFIFPKLKPYTKYIYYKYRFQYINKYSYEAGIKQKRRGTIEFFFEENTGQFSSFNRPK